MDMPPYLKRSGSYLYLQKRVPTDIVRQIPPETGELSEDELVLKALGILQKKEVVATIN